MNGADPSDTEITKKQRGDGVRSAELIPHSRSDPGARTTDHPELEKAKETPPHLLKLAMVYRFIEGIRHSNSRRIDVQWEEEGHPHTRNAEECHNDDDQGMTVLMVDDEEHQQPNSVGNVDVVPVCPRTSKPSTGTMKEPKVASRRAASGRPALDRAHCLDNATACTRNMWYLGECVSRFLDSRNLCAAPPLTPFHQHTNPPSSIQQEAHRDHRQQNQVLDHHSELVSQDNAYPTERGWGGIPSPSLPLEAQRDSQQSHDGDFLSQPK